VKPMIEQVTSNLQILPLTFFATAYGDDLYRFCFLRLLPTPRRFRAYIASSWRRTGEPTPPQRAQPQAWRVRPSTVDVVTAAWTAYRDVGERRGAVGMNGGPRMVVVEPRVFEVPSSQLAFRRGCFGWRPMRIGNG
jgi:hypothetical protein